MNKNKVKFINNIEGLMRDMDSLMQKHNLSYTNDKAENELLIFFYYKALKFKEN